MNQLKTELCRVSKEGFLEVRCTLAKDHESAWHAMYKEHILIATWREPRTQKEST